MKHSSCHLFSDQTIFVSNFVPCQNIDLKKHFQSHVDKDIRKSVVCNPFSKSYRNLSIFYRSGKNPKPPLKKKPGLEYVGNQGAVFTQN